MKDLSNKGIIPADELSDWQSWSMGELQSGKLGEQKSAQPFDGLTAAQVEALTASLAPAETPMSIEPLPEPDEIETAPPAPQLGYPTAAELESIHQEAWQTGHDAGFAAGEAEGREWGQREGLAAGLAEAQQRFTEAWAPLEQLATGFSDALHALETQLSGDVLALAVKLAERLVAAHLAADPRAIEPLLRQALAALPATLAQGRLRVNPLDLGVARAFLQQERPETVWQWIEDASVPRGGCLVETPSLSQDLTHPARLAAMSRALGLAEETDDDDVDNV
ncbi:FliH/SctL family protein [Paludibacterium purpuratum]|uniref:Flagellar assembly protein FliH n=1 Tax=Paludibacterium purpuratum TaxID=1144873 RepID=A0A4R7BF73_9NEIS|nr:FliH/SctL family protein [Paludibacterium purpuratum]TDR82932.1 flagellar assembly protein FliH [Paludibacterium purpuratum]